MDPAESVSSNRTPIDEARDELQAAVPKAAKTLAELLDAEDKRVRLRAAETILDRAGLVKAKHVTSTVAAREVGGEVTELDRLLDNIEY